MKVLSLFDGISCGRVALERAGIPVEAYYASEIDKYAMQISQKNWYKIIQLGDVKEVGSLMFAAKHHILPNEINLLIGGSPCQDLSIAKVNRKGLDGERSGLFWEYVRILNEVKPKYFILENVASMAKDAKESITKQLFGIEPIMINAALVSAQQRKRLFWVGIRNDEIQFANGVPILTYNKIEIIQPIDREIFLKDILEKGEADRLKSYCIDASYYKGANWKQYKEKGRRQLIKVGQFNSGGQGDRIYSPEGKSVTLSAMGGGRGAKTGLYLTNKDVRKLTPVECERLQGLPDNYTGGVSNTQRYKALGNAFNVDVIAHILSFILKQDATDK